MEIYIFSDGDHGNKTIIKNTKKALIYLTKKYSSYDKNKKEIKKKMFFLTELFSGRDFPLIERMEKEMKCLIKDGNEVYWPIFCFCIKKGIKILPIKSDLNENYEQGMLENCLVYLNNGYKNNKNKNYVYIIDIGEAHVKKFEEKIKKEFFIKPKVFYFKP